jgi:hypothetical protein
MKSIFIKLLKYFKSFFNQSKEKKVSKEVKEARKNDPFIYD